MTDEHRDAIADAGRTEERTGYIHTWLAVAMLPGNRA